MYSKRCVYENYTAKLKWSNRQCEDSTQSMFICQAAVWNSEWAGFWLIPGRDTKANLTHKYTQRSITIPSIIRLKNCEVSEISLSRTFNFKLLRPSYHHYLLPGENTLRSSQTNQGALDDSRQGCCLPRLTYFSRHMETVTVHRICSPGEESGYETVGPRLPGNLAHLGQGSPNDTAQGPNPACKWCFIGKRPHSLVYMLPWRTGTPVAGLQSQWRPHMAKSKTFTMWPFG